MTMEPTDKYVPLRPPPAIPDFLGPNYRLPTSHSSNSSNAPTLKHKRSDRSISPTPSWWSPRKLFGRKGSLSSQGSVDKPSEDEEHRGSVTSSSSEGTRARTMSPEALKRFLQSDDVPVVSDAEPADRFELCIPDDIAEEDDDDLLVSAVSDTIPKTILSPPPSKPSMSRKNSANSADILHYPTDNSSMITLKPAPSSRLATPRQPVLSSMNFYEKYEQPTSRFSLSSDEGSVYDDESDEEGTDPASPSTDNDTPSFYHSDEEDDDNDVEDCLSPTTGPPPSKRAALVIGRGSLEGSLAQAFQGYRLPRNSVDATKGDSILASPPLLPTGGKAFAINSPPLLAMPTSSVVEDFVSELKQAGLV